MITVEEGVNNLKEVLGKWSETYPTLQSTFNRDDWDTVFTYLNFDYRIRRMIYTTNWIERLKKPFRRTLT